MNRWISVLAPVALALGLGACAQENGGGTGSGGLGSGGIEGCAVALGGTCLVGADGAGGVVDQLTAEGGPLAQFADVLGAAELTAAVESTLAGNADLQQQISALLAQGMDDEALTALLEGGLGDAFSGMLEGNTEFAQLTELLGPDALAGLASLPDVGGGDCLVPAGDTCLVAAPDSGASGLLDLASQEGNPLEGLIADAGGAEDFAAILSNFLESDQEFAGQIENLFAQGDFVDGIATLFMGDLGGGGAGGLEDFLGSGFINQYSETLMNFLDFFGELQP